MDGYDSKLTGPRSAQEYDWTLARADDGWIHLTVSVENQSVSDREKRINSTCAVALRLDPLDTNVSTM